MTDPLHPKYLVAMLGIASVTMLGAMWLFATNFDSTEAGAFLTWLAATSAILSGVYKQMRTKVTESQKQAIADYLNSQQAEAERIIDSGEECDSSRITL